MPLKAAPLPRVDDWSISRSASHLDYVGDKSNWTASPTQAGPLPTAGSVNLSLPPDNSPKREVCFARVQTGYNNMLFNRFLIGVEADASFPAGDCRNQ